METSHRRLLKLHYSAPRLTLPSHPIVLVGNRVRQLRTYQCLEPSAHRLRPVVKIRARRCRLRWRSRGPRSPSGRNSRGLRHGLAHPSPACHSTACPLSSTKHPPTANFPLPNTPSLEPPRTHPY